MKIAVFGAGAIGGYLAVNCMQAGAEVSVIARGPHLAAIRENGLTLESEGRTTTVNLPCTDDPETAGPQDYVFVTLKATGLAPAAAQIASLMGLKPRWSPASTAFLIGISMASTLPGATAPLKASIPAASFGAFCRPARLSDASSIQPLKWCGPAISSIRTAIVSRWASPMGPRARA